MIGHVLAIIRVISDVFLVTSRKKLRFNYNSSFLLVIQSSLSLILGIVGFFIFKPSIALLVILYACLSVFFVSIANILGIYAFKYDEFSKLAPLSGASVIYALILGILFLNQIPTILQSIGIFLVVVGIYLQGNEGKWRYPLSILKQKPVLIFLFAPLWAVISRTFMNKTLELAPLKDVVVFNLFFSLPIVFFIYLILNRGKFPVLSKSEKVVPVYFWFIPLVISEATSVILNVASIYFLDLVVAELIFSFSILLNLMSGKIFFREKIQFRIIPTFLIFAGVVLSIIK